MKKKYSKLTPVSIIVPNWNGGEKIIRCLESITKLDYPKFEVIVIDNNSLDGSNREIKKKFGKFKNFKIIENKENVGNTEGLNQGFRLSNYSLILTLDNDVILDKNMLKELVKIILNDKKIGIVAPKLYFYKKSNFFNSTGYSVNLITGKTSIRGFNKKDVGQFDKQEEVDYVQDGVLLVKKEVLDKVKLMDNAFFVYYEDTDFCLRVRKAGYKIVYVPSAKAWHDGNTRQKGFTPFRAYHFIKSKILFMRKHSTNKFLFFSFFFFFYTPYRLLIITIKNPSSILPYFKGIKDGITHPLNYN